MNTLKKILFKLLDIILAVLDFASNLVSNSESDDSESSDSNCSSCNSD